MAKAIVVLGAVTAIALVAGLHETHPPARRASAAVHPTDRADLAVMRDARPAIAGVAIRWCASQDACRSVQTSEGPR